MTIIIIVVIMITMIIAMTAVGLHLNETFYDQYPTIRSVFENSQSLMNCKLFVSYRTAVFELALVF